MLVWWVWLGGGLEVHQRDGPRGLSRFFFGAAGGQ